MRRLEDNKKLRDAILSVHHTCIHTLTATPAFKIIENHEGKAYIQLASQAPPNAGLLLQEPNPSPQKQPSQKRGKSRTK